jgi:hypothetical protein
MRRRIFSLARDYATSHSPPMPNDDRHEKPTIPAPASEAERAFERELAALNRGRWGVPRGMKLPLAPEAA